MGATFTRIKNWVKEVLSHEDLNKEIDNILENFDPQGMGDYSEDAAQMKLVTDPGAAGSENLPTSLAGEIERLRFMVQQITGESPWYGPVGTNLKEVSDFFASSSSADRIIDAKRSANSSRARFLIPGGGGSVKLLASNGEPFVYAIGGNVYTLTDDVTLSGLLGEASPTPVTAVLPDGTGVESAEVNRILGAGGTGLFVDDLGNAQAIFDHNDFNRAIAITKDSTTEYAVRLPNKFNVVTATPTPLGWTEKAPAFINDILMRKVGFAADGSATPSVVIDSTTTLTSIRLIHVFLDAAGTLYQGVNISRGFPRPSAINAGSYWQNPITQEWSRANGATWEIVPQIYVGFCAVNPSNVCVMAQPAEISVQATSSNDHTFKRHAASLEVMKSFSFAGINFRAGTLLNFNPQEADKMFLYLKEDGTIVGDDVAPHDMRATLRCWLHPNEMWLCIGLPDLSGSPTSGQLSQPPMSLAFDDFFDFDGGTRGDVLTSSRRYVPGYLPVGDCLSADPSDSVYRADVMPSVMLGFNVNKKFEGVVNTPPVPDVEWTPERFLFDQRYLAYGAEMDTYAATIPLGLDVQQMSRGPTITARPLLPAHSHAWLTRTNKTWEPALIGGGFVEVDMPLVNVSPTSSTSVLGAHSAGPGADAFYVSESSEKTENHQLEAPRTLSIYVLFKL